MFGKYNFTWNKFLESPSTIPNFTAFLGKKDFQVIHFISKLFAQN